MQCGLQATGDAISAGIPSWHSRVTGLIWHRDPMSAPGQSETRPTTFQRSAFSTILDIVLAHSCSLLLQAGEEDSELCLSQRRPDEGPVVRTIAVEGEMDPQRGEAFEWG
jgi:hypothetical protein